MVEVMQFRKALYLWTPVVLWTALIYFLSSQPGLSIGEGWIDFLTRKPAHIGEYTVLFLLLHRAFRDTFFLAGQKLYLVAGIFTFLYAVSDELHQMFVPTRAGSIYDLGFDLLGIFGGLFLIRYWRLRTRM